MKLRTLYLPSIATLILATPLAALALTPRPLQPNEHPTNLPGATTIEAPPAGFDPITASDEELAYHGFPPRPNPYTEPKSYASWADAMRASHTRVVPQLDQTSIFHGAPNHNNNNAIASAVTTEIPPPAPISNPIYSSSWSGYIDQSGATSYGPSSFYYIVSTFVVPVAKQAPGTCNGGWAYATAWDGIDGFGSADVLQAGIEFDAYCSALARASYYSVWYEWFPYGEVRISGFPITAGDDLFIEVWHTSPTQGYAYLVNYNTKQSVEVGFTAYPGYSLIGNSAEWVIEDPVVGGITVDFVDIPYWDSYAYTQSSVLYDMATGTQVIEKVGLTTIAAPTFLGPESFVDIWY